MKDINKKNYWKSVLILFTVLLIISFIAGLFKTIEPLFYTIVGIWVCLILLPLFGEIEIFGFKLKKEIEGVKSEIQSGFQSMRNEIKNTNTQQLNIYGNPPSDGAIRDQEESLKKIEKMVELSRETVEDLREELYGSEAETSGSDYLLQEEKVSKFLTIRWSLHSLLRDVWEKHKGKFDDGDRDTRQDGDNVYTILMVIFNQYSIINTDVYIHIINILTICEAAINGKSITDTQGNYVKDNYTIVYGVLDLLMRDLKGDTENG